MIYGLLDKWIDREEIDRSININRFKQKSINNFLSYSRFKRLSKCQKCPAGLVPRRDRAQQGYFPSQGLDLRVEMSKYRAIGGGGDVVTSTMILFHLKKYVSRNYYPFNSDAQQPVNTFFISSTLCSFSDLFQINQDQLFLCTIPKIYLSIHNLKFIQVFPQRISRSYYHPPPSPYYQNDKNIVL